MKLDRQAPSIGPRAGAAPKAVLVLEDGTIFGKRPRFGANPGGGVLQHLDDGYQEILTDPSYAGQDHHFHFSAYRERRCQRRGRRVSSSHVAASSCARTLLTPANWRAGSMDRWLKDRNPDRSQRGRHPPPGQLHSRPRAPRGASPSPRTTVATSRYCSGPQRHGPGLGNMDLTGRGFVRRATTVDRDPVVH
jgi:hypothetical protein